MDFNFKLKIYPIIVGVSTMKWMKLTNIQIDALKLHVGNASFSTYSVNDIQSNNKNILTWSPHTPQFQFNLVKSQNIYK